MVEDDTNRIPDDADEDIPMPLSESTDANAAANESLPAREKIDMEQQHKFSVENFKNNVASQFLNVCLLGLLLLAILDFFKGNGDALSNGVEALKTLAMVAVGFLFGSSAKAARDILANPGARGMRVAGAWIISDGVRKRTQPQIVDGCVFCV